MASPGPSRASCKSGIANNVCVRASACYEPSLQTYVRPSKEIQASAVNDWSVRGIYHRGSGSVEWSTHRSLEIETSTFVLERFLSRADPVGTPRPGMSKLPTQDLTSVQ